MRLPAPRAPLRTIALTAIALLLLAGGRSAEDVLAGTPPEVAASLEGEAVAVLDGEADSLLLAFVRFERPRPEVMELLRHAERQTEYRPELHDVRTVRTLPDGRIDEQSMKILFRKLVYRLRYREDRDAARFDWHLDPDFDNDLQQIEGFWELYPYVGRGGATLGRFGSRVDVGPAVPDFIQDRLGKRTVLNYIENVRRWIDSGGTWRP